LFPVEKVERPPREGQNIDKHHPILPAFAPERDMGAGIFNRRFGSQKYFLKNKVHVSSFLTKTFESLTSSHLKFA